MVFDKRRKRAWEPRRKENEVEMINVLKLRKVKESFVASHPKIVAFLRQQLMGETLEEGTVIEIKIKKPGKKPVVAKMTVTKKDSEIFKELRGEKIL